MSLVEGPHATLSKEAIALLRERAEKLAHADGRVGSDPVLAQQRTADLFVCFRLLGERYALPLSVVREVVLLRSIAHVPGAPEHVVGLTRLRGQVLALVDLRRYLHGVDNGRADTDLALIVVDGELEYGIVCSEVEGLLPVAAADIMEVPQNMPSRVAACLQGITQRDVLLVSPANLRNQHDFVVKQGRAGGD